ncbi:MAG: selenide, water dikinase SelD [Castellaniella sp.]|uniref:selenide, water dikinase SelD n=1 Tax=Castellaniella sp. TaxID=1955812 RepID=UPI002A371A07|nr:selenide, water dikinase SelD [Castellaniella sp.]MDY0309628.1 selenide, water dikinase SelD [Castellaniella sp.]
MNAPDITTPAPRLTALSHGGGCGCKIAPDVLARLMRDALPAGPFPELLVGTQSSDDAAVYRINDEQALIATTDFFMPIVDDPHDFGRIAATNALSDVYAMGGRPILALALVGMPIKTLPHDTIAAILAGGAAVCQQAGIPIAGGHSIDSVEPIYGLAVIGLAHPDHIKRNDRARAGDVLILSKPLGVGILSAALKKDRLDAEGYRAMIASTTRLNTPGTRLAELDTVHALTDVTGFGLLGHTLEMCRGADLSATVSYADLPWLAPALDLARDGIHTGASERNWHACSAQVTLDTGLPDEARALLSDPQTSGGLLVACAPEAADEVLALLRADGFAQAARIGCLNAGPAHIRVS